LVENRIWLVSYPPGYRIPALKTAVPVCPANPLQYK
jgi:hypothetical protein